MSLRGFLSSLSSSSSSSSLSSSLLSPQSAPCAGLQFFGPSSSSLGLSSDDIISAKDSRTGNSVPIFATKTSKHSKPNIQIARILPNGAHQSLATATFSSSRGTIVLSLRGQEITMNTDWGSSTGSKTFSTPAGELRWKPKDSGTGFELLDLQRNKLATWRTSSDSGLSNGYPRLDFLVSGDDFFVEMVVASGLAMMKMEEKQAKQASKIIQHLVGG